MIPFLKMSLAIAILLTLPSEGRAATPISTDTGPVRGAVADGVLSFKGIPFAAPPLGALRWRAPQPPAPWREVRAATAYGHDCMQLPFPSDAAPLGSQPAEDCLTLNVWRPADGTTHLPVLVWIYGGGFVNGGASPAVYSGAPLAQHGIVVVSFNYRVGRFGFFGHPQLTRANEDQGHLVNYGFLDQIAALQWVRRNIASFGGDPARVTIEGESAGGMSVHALLTSPLASRLFAGAVIQSGGDARLLTSTVHEAEQAGLAFAQSKGIAPDDPHALAKLRALPPDAIVDGLNMGSLFNPPPGPPSWTFPVIDGTIAVDAASAYHGKKFAHVPVMVGATSDDMFGADGPMMRGVPEIADMISAHGVPVFAYRFSYVAGQPPGAGAGHASDIPFFLGTIAVKYGAATTAHDLEATSLASTYLANFVKHGNPNGASLPAWPEYGTGKRAMLDLDARGGATVIGH